MENRNEQQKVTVDAALEIIQKRLGSILVPVELTEQIAMPLHAVKMDLQACIDALRNPVNAEAEEAQQAVEEADLP